MSGGRCSGEERGGGGDHVHPGLSGASGPEREEVWSETESGPGLDLL